MAKRKSVKEKNKELEEKGKQIRNYGLKLRIYPNEDQQELICRTFGCARLIFNKYLAQRQEYYKNTGKTLTVSAFKHENLIPLKQSEEFGFLKEVDKFALEVACESVEAAYDKFFKKQNKYPRFKTKRKAKKAYTTKFTNDNIKIIDNKYITLPKLGKIEITMSKGILEEARILNATISQKGNKFYVSLCLEEVVNLVVPIENSEIKLNQVIGLDLGLKDFFVSSNGSDSYSEPHPKFIKKSEEKLSKLQRRLSKKERFSNNFYKAANKVAKPQEEIANQRKDFQHKTSRKLVNENQVVVVETLNIKGMVKNRKLSKAISDSGWSQFLAFLKYKLQWEGKHFVQVDRWFASSKLCSSCGEKKIALTLSERDWACSSCGAVHQRDENAAINLRKEGLRILNI